MGEDYFFQVAALADQVLHGVLVGNAHHLLLDDGSIVEHFGDIVAGGADQFHAPLKRLVIGPRANEGRQK